MESPKQICTLLPVLAKSVGKKVTKTESTPVQVSLVVFTVKSVGVIGTELGFAEVEEVNVEEGDHWYVLPNGEVGEPPRVTLVPSQIVNVSSPASVGTLG